MQLLDAIETSENSQLSAITVSQFLRGTSEVKRSSFLSPAMTSSNPFPQEVQVSP